jgi:2-iminobutanoate/2-iminopropanoate deaminase
VTEPTRDEWYVPTLQEPISHYTHAVSFGDLVCVSGFLPTTQTGELVGEDDVEAQTYQVLRNLEQALRAAGSSLQDILKVTVYLMDIRDRARVNLARQEMFGSARPASTLVEVSKLALPGAKVEIDAIACRRRPGADSGHQASA